MLGIIKRNEEEFYQWSLEKRREYLAKLEEKGKIGYKKFLSTELGFLTLLCEFKGKPFKPDAYQARFLTIKNNRRIILKSRQVGYSFIFGAECLARCHLRKNHRAVIISYNLEDAKEKIKVTKELYEGLPLEYQKKLIKDNEKELRFKSNSRNAGTCSILSWPAKAPRGKAGDIYLDELAHAQNDDQIYSGSTALISRIKNGQLTIASTPLGRRGKFWEIYTEAIREYPGYWRQRVPWWLCRAFCNDIPTACKEAPKMSTEERVARFGTTALKEQRNSLSLDIFQQEFECKFVDESIAFFPYSIIESCTQQPEDIPTYSSPQRLKWGISDRDGKITAGYDVGRKRHPAELVVVEEWKSKMYFRMRKKFENMDFSSQEGYLTHFMEVMGDRLDTFYIDEGGLGQHLAENLKKKFPNKVVPITFTRKIKSDIATQFKILLESKGVVLPNDREIKGQIHSIKQKITSSGNTVYDAARNEHHHADIFWALGLACHRRKIVKRITPSAGVRVIGLDKDEDSKEDLELLNSEQENKGDNLELLNSEQKESNNLITEYSKEDIKRIIKSLEIAKSAFERNSDSESAKRTQSRIDKFKKLL